MSLAQQRVLVGLVRLCDALGAETDARAVSRVSGVKPHATVLALQGLVRRQLAVRHHSPESWSPTMSGRGMAKYVRAREPRSAPVSDSTTSGD